jgi:competence protein ComEC
VEKSKAHWKAAHPFLYISVVLMLGLFVASIFLRNKDQPLIAAAILSIGLLLLQFGLWIPLPRIYQSLLVLLILMSWGMAIYLATHEKNLIQLPYPKTWVEASRNWVIQKINANILNKEANGFASALLLGVKSDLNKTLLQAYTQLGIIHIVAISGMHLEIIFKNLTRITQWLPRRKFFLGLELLLVLLGVWWYTLMAFASPSIVRASVFFSIYFIGKYFGQSNYSLNTIAGGMLIFLLFDVKNIESLSLQLSYGAVIGIHLFYPLLFKFLPMDNPILIFLWSNLCISFSAQLTTLPILLYHFHQMPSMVLLSNFIMVPLSNILLYGLFFLVACPSLFGLCAAIGNGLAQYILWINTCIRFVYTLPMSSSLAIKFDQIQMVLYYLLLWMIYSWLNKKQAIYLVYAIAAMLGYVLLKLFSRL